MLLQETSDLTPLIQDICFGVCRYYYRLAAIADQLLTKRPKVLSVWVTLLIGLYQLYYLRIPDYAVVHETVALLSLIKKTWAKGLVNAVLRRFCQEQTVLVAGLKDDFAFNYNHPDWFISRVQKAYPHAWEDILQANDIHPPMFLRINQIRTSVTAYLSRLNAAGLSGGEVTFAPESIYLTTPCTVSELPAFAEGEVSVQDCAAQLAVQLLDLKPGARVLDACCAPGGKTCHIVESQPDVALCLALDVDSKRLTRVYDNLTRLGLQAILKQGNALYPSAWWDGQLFDRILLDAPCSATGVIRRRPDIKLLRTPTEIVKVAQLQYALLNALWPLLAPEGLMVYATCSILPEENALQVARFMAEHPDCQCIEEEKPWGRPTGYGWQILPGDHNMDGFFYSVLKKS